ncbi:MAG: chromosome segregation protein SMC [Candidatus Bathyarchaeota archaeon]|nr:chromosome segregation protein SMC [Candidatus Termiticorpusculum sp.]
MPYIKRIELKGFKSFGPQTVKVNLDKGFTAITGPNGSGKTNIMDALIFSLGELSPKKMRADNASKLIFHGSEKGGYEKSKMAKVIVQFDNTDGEMPVDTSTVTISREVYRSGQSVYRLNGRRMSRTNIIDTLSVAAISSVNQNIIPQGQITRLTEVNPDERRKMIEDLIGIGHYDDEKVEAEKKLEVADVSIKTSMGRIDEVQKRFDELERERNQLSRYNFIQEETKKFYAIKISNEVIQLNKQLQENAANIAKVQERVNKLRNQRELRTNKRREIEGEWRKLSGEALQEGSSQILSVQIKIGELKSNITELTTQINSSQATLDALTRIAQNRQENHNSIQTEIKDNRSKIRKFQTEHGKLEEQITEKKTLHETIGNESAQLWEGFSDNTQKIRSVEVQIENHTKRLAYLRSEYTKDKSTMRICVGRLKNLTVRKEKFHGSLTELEKSLVELEQVQRDQKIQIKTLENTINRKFVQKEIVQKEIADAERIARSAKDAVIEFTTQKDLAATIAQEEKALRSIEEMGDVGAINGIYGRLRDLIKVDKNYKKAVEAAATGWLDALVVKDVDSAFMCAETLRRMKLGRIKIIPLQGTIPHKTKIAPMREGVVGQLVAFIKYDKKFEFAVDYAFGDTAVVSNDKIGFTLSNDGYRAVTVNGDLYESGAFESGFYRAPIDFSTIIPSENALKSLDDAVKALQTHLTQRDSDITSIDEEIEHAKIEMTRLTEFITTLDREIVRLKRSVKRTQLNVRQSEKYGGKLEREIAAYKGRMSLYVFERNTIKKAMQKNYAELGVLRKKTDLTHFQNLEVQREHISEELNSLRQQSGTLQTEINTLQSNFEKVLRAGYQNIKIEISKDGQQQRKLEKDIAEASQRRDSLKTELVGLEKSYEELSSTVLSAREESGKFTKQIDDIDNELQNLNPEYEQTDKLLQQLTLTNETTNIRYNDLQNQLKQYGYEQAFEVTQKQVENANTTINMMKYELERIGAVNQLAAKYYDEQASRYRELSIRLNELDRERQAIVAFMDEIESKKLKVFTTAFDKINNSLKTYFDKLTGGGTAMLKLEKPDEPFSGGIDMIVQFPNKPSIVVSAASGGERSCSAVAFIFSLREFSHTSFYILDEADAHLDAFHTTKLAELLLEEATNTQFIVISLRPEMVNKAQKVYGVYERNGISNVITAKFPPETLTKGAIPKQ